MVGAVCAGMSASYPEALQDIASGGTMTTINGTSPRTCSLGGSIAGWSAGHFIASISLTDSTDADSREWLRDGATSNWEVRAHVTSGSLTSGIVDAWLSLDTIRSWVNSTAGSVTFTLEIGRVGANTALTTGTVTL